MSENPVEKFVRSPIAWLLVVAVLAGGGALYWISERAAARATMERQRLASEQAEWRREKEAEEKRERDRQRLADEIRTLKEAENLQRQQAGEVRQAELGKKQFAVDERLLAQPTSLERQLVNFDQVRSNYQEREQRHEDESELRRAREDVERQRRYLQRREFEDQMARARREAAAR